MTEIVFLALHNGLSSLRCFGMFINGIYHDLGILRHDFSFLNQKFELFILNLRLSDHSFIKTLSNQCILSLQFIDHRLKLNNSRDMSIIIIYITYTCFLPNRLSDAYSSWRKSVVFLSNCSTIAGTSPSYATSVVLDTES